MARRIVNQPKGLATSDLGRGAAIVEPICPPFAHYGIGTTMSSAGPLRPWEIASVIFFAYTIAAAIAVSSLAAQRRLQAVAAAAMGLLVTGASILVPETPVLHGWVLPPALLLLAYWSSGRLFVAPMPAIETALAGIDCMLRVPWLAARTPRGVAEILEVAYAGVYPLIPIALVIFLFHTPAPNIDRFWAVILITDYLCFGVLPWVQTRPPRALEAGAGRRHRLHAAGVSRGAHE